MASLELIPNPVVLAVQAGVFLANFVVVKKLLVEPYLTVRDRREALTVGSKDQATKALADSEAAAQKIHERLSEAAEKAKTDKEKIRGVAVTKRQGLLADAEQRAKTHVESIERQIKDELAKERAKIPAVVSQLTDEVYKVALS